MLDLWNPTDTTENVESESWGLGLALSLTSSMTVANNNGKQHVNEECQAVCSTRPVHALISFTPPQSYKKSASLWQMTSKWHVQEYTEREQQSWDLSSHFLSLGLSLSIYKKVGLMNSKLHFNSNIPALPLHCEVLFTQAQISSESDLCNLYHIELQGTICTSLPFVHFVRIGQNGPNSDQHNSFSAAPKLLRE